MTVSCHQLTHIGNSTRHRCQRLVREDVDCINVECHRYVARRYDRSKKHTTVDIILSADLTISQHRSIVPLTMFGCATQQIVKYSARGQSRNFQYEYFTLR